MSIELGLLVAVIAFVTLVITVILSLGYALLHIKQLTRAAHQVEQELVAVAAQLKPLIEHTDLTIQTINDGMTSSTTIVKNSKQITQSIAATLQAIQEVTHNVAQRAEAKLREDATQEQVQLSLQWAEIVMQTVKMVQQKRQVKSDG